MRVPARAWVAALLGAAGILPLQTAVAATSSGIESLTSRPLPMAVEGGTLAEVTAHAIPFPLGSSTLGAGVAAALDAILATAATDCFLFAQIVGHVQPGPAADGDTRAAHRLARARADSLASALQRAGMPAGAVATTWDFGLATPRPRATLWLFERTIGSDCHGTALPGAAPSAVVALAADASPAGSTAAARAVDRLEPAPGIHLPVPVPGRTQQPAVDSQVAKQASPDAVDREPAPGIHLPEVRLAAVSMLVGAPQGSPPAAPQEEIAAAARADERAGMAAPEPQAGPPAPQADATDAGASTALATIEVGFDPDSSFLSPAALADLEAWRSTLPAAAQVCRVEVVAAVGDRAGRLQPEPARLYNEWLAERRQSRLVDWLRVRSGCELREVRRDLRLHDESRRVSLRLSVEPAAHPLADPAVGRDEPGTAPGTLSHSPAPAEPRASPTPRRA